MPKGANYDSYNDMLDRHKQKMVDGERNMDEWQKSMNSIIMDIDLKNFFFLDNPVQKPNPHVQVQQRPVPGNYNLRPTPG